MNLEKARWYQILSRSQFILMEFERNKRHRAGLEKAILHQTGGEAYAWAARFHMGVE